MTWDLFISHASEDKAEVARPLADALRGRQLEVWYDEYTLRIGDSLREKIDHGLRESYYGVVVLSPNFFAKKWPQQELDGLFSMASTERDRILPLWHKVTADDVKRFSPILAGKVAVPTDLGIDHVLAKIVQKVCTYRVRDHHGQIHEIDISCCSQYGAPIIPQWLSTTPENMCSEWLVERLSGGADLRLCFASQWYDGTWFVIDKQQGDGEVVNLQQLDDLRPSSATTTTTTPPPQSSGEG